MGADALVREAEQPAAAVLRVAHLAEQLPAQQPGDHLGDGGPVEPDPLPHRPLIEAGFGGQGVQDGELGEVISSETIVFHSRWCAC